MAQRKRGRERRRARPEGPPLPAPGPTPLRKPAGRDATASVTRPIGLAWTAVRSDPVPYAVGAAVVVAAFALYVATAARDIVYGDTPELTGAALTLGVAHPPGYPIFTVLGWLLGQLAPGPLPFRVALLSVLCHAATVGVVYGATYRFTRSVPAAAVAAVALATEPLFWAWSLVAEVFPLNDLLSATMLLLIALWHEHPERKRLLLAGALVGGLGLADHQTIGLLSFAVFYVLWRRRQVLLRDPRLLLNTAVAFLLGLTPYLELLFAAARRPFWSWGDLRTAGDLLAHILRRDYGSGQLIVDPRFSGGSPVDRVVALIGMLDPVQWLLLVVGTAYAWRVKRWYATYLLIGFAVAGPLFAIYSNVRIDLETTQSVLERFFLMPHVVIAPLAGFAVIAARDVAAARLRLPPRAVEITAAAAAVLAALVMVPLDYAVLDQSDNHAARKFATDILSTMKPGSLFLGAGDTVVFPIWYLQTVEGMRPDVATVAMPLVSGDWYIREVKRNHPELVIPDDRYAPGAGQIRSMIDANRSKRPIAALGDLPDPSTQGIYWFYSRGLIYEIRPTGQIVTLREMADDNNAVLPTYHLPAEKERAGPFRPWERLTLADYARVYYAVGHEYELQGDLFKGKDPKEASTFYESARDWYRRALAVKPDLIEAKTALERLSALDRVP